MGVSVTLCMMSCCGVIGGARILGSISTKQISGDTIPIGMGFHGSADYRTVRMPAFPFIGIVLLFRLDTCFIAGS